MGKSSQEAGGTRQGQQGRGGKVAPENVMEIAAIGKRGLIPRITKKHTEHSPPPTHIFCPKQERLIVAQLGHWPMGSHLPLTEVLMGMLTFLHF